MIDVRRLVFCTLLAGAAACADDPPSQSLDGSVSPSNDAGIDKKDSAGDDVDAASDRAEDIVVRDAAPPDSGVTQTEPPLVVPTCDGITDTLCCRSAIGFEDGSTGHFLPPACCKMALSNPVPVTTPTACGRGALRLDASFQSTTAASMCDTQNAADACDYRTGELSRAVLTSLDLSGLTMSAAVYLEGAALPADLAFAQLFILGKNGLVDGPQQPIRTPSAWTAIEFPVPNGGPGVDVRLIGVRISLNGQAWTGHAYLDEISWH